MRLDASSPKSRKLLTANQNPVFRLQVKIHIALKKLPIRNHGPIDFTIALDRSVLRIHW